MLYSLFVSSTATRRFPVALSLLSRKYSTKMSESLFERLSKDVVPVHYKILLTPCLKTFTFCGKQTIDIKIVKPVKSITLNSIDIDIKSATFNNIVADIEYAEKEEKVTLNFPQSFAQSTGKLELSFTGVLNENMKGFYRSKYTTDDGVEKPMAVTQFEATDARRAFPCWDEPSCKATFEISLTVAKHLTVLSNMPEIKRTEEAGDTVRVDFDRTPIMSTYLVAMVVGEFDLVESMDTDGVQVRVFTALGKSDRGKFALDVACRTLPFYREYFDIAYPLPKMDLIAIPDFAAGAMENWGLITYRETALLIDEAESSSSTKQTVALVVGHEIAHQWFGNLVTMEWWTHLWLNEGFASWIEYLCVDFCYPEFDIWTQFTSTDYSMALELDSLKTSHPIEVEVKSPDEIDEIFDHISYCKGASIIRMLHDFLGDESFRNGLRSYLKRHKYSNAQTEQLWTSLAESSGKPVSKIMSTWTQQMGYPTITLTPVCEKKGDPATAITVEQSRFVADGSDEGCDKYRWMVPITLCPVDKPEVVVKKFVLEHPKETVSIPAQFQGVALRANPGAIGVYRVRYNECMLPPILEALKQGQLPARDRLALQSDLFALARAGLISTVEVIKVVQGYRQETNFTVWADLAKNLAQVRLLVEEKGQMDHYNRFVQSLLSPVFSKLGWEENPTDSHNERLLRPLLLALLGKAGHKEVVEEGKRRFKAHCSVDSGSKAIPADLRGPVYSMVLRNGGKEEIDAVMKLYDRTDLHEERMRILRTVGCAPSAHTPQVLELAMSDKVRTQDKVFVILGCTGTVTGRQLTWSFLKENWTCLKDKYSGLFLLGRLVKGIVDDFTTKQKAEEVANFFKANPAPCQRSVDQAIETISINAAQFDRDADSIVDYLKAL